MAEIASKRYTPRLNDPVLIILIALLAFTVALLVL
jgi:hypothetical protein